MSPSLWTLITPAFIATVISIAINIRLDKTRAQREYLKDTFEAVKSTVDAAVTAAAEYFPLAAAERTPVVEAKIWMADRELRFALPALVEGSSSQLKVELESLTASFDDLISSLTGGSFQSASAAPDLRQLRRVASAGAELKARLSSLWHAELRRVIDQDPLSKFINYWTAPIGTISQQ